ncbi:MAG: hypothetical protein GY756_08920 [bacterium]|nr:hypothetical protein [bacterium]
MNLVGLPPNNKFSVNKNTCYFFIKNQKNAFGKLRLQNNEEYLLGTIESQDNKLIQVEKFEKFSCSKEIFNNPQYADWKNSKAKKIVINFRDKAVYTTRTNYLMMGINFKFTDCLLYINQEKKTVEFKAKRGYGQAWRYNKNNRPITVVDFNGFDKSRRTQPGEELVVIAREPNW